MLIELKDRDNQTAHAYYGLFHIGAEAEKYVLHVSEFSGTAGDSMASHNGMMFSTHDHDNDVDADRSCAQIYLGSWWYRNCHLVTLNGRYDDGTSGVGINWYTRRGHIYSLKETSMKLRPRRGNRSVLF